MSEAAKAGEDLAGADREDPLTDPHNQQEGAHQREADDAQANQADEQQAVRLAQAGANSADLNNPERTKLPPNDDIAAAGNEAN